MSGDPPVSRGPRVIPRRPANNAPPPPSNPSTDNAMSAGSRVIPLGSDAVVWIGSPVPGCTPGGTGGIGSGRVLDLPPPPPPREDGTPVAGVSAGAGAGGPYCCPLTGAMFSSPGTVPGFCALALSAALTLAPVGGNPRDAR